MATAKRRGCMRADDADVRCRILRNLSAKPIGTLNSPHYAGQSLAITAGRSAMDRKTRIAVVGAGLGGMTVAGFLQRAGFSVTVYEQAPAFSRIGAGIILSANVMKVLRRLGLEQMVVDIGIKANCYVSRAWDTGETMYRIDFDAEKRGPVRRTLCQHSPRRPARGAGEGRGARLDRVQSSSGRARRDRAMPSASCSRTERRWMPISSSAPTA